MHPDELRAKLAAEARTVPVPGRDEARAGVAQVVRRQRLLRAAAAVPVVVVLLLAGVSLALDGDERTDESELAVGDPASTTATTDDDRAATTTAPQCVEGSLRLETPNEGAAEITEEITSASGETCAGPTSLPLCPPGVTVPEMAGCWPASDPTDTMGAPGSTGTAPSWCGGTAVTTIPCPSTDPESTGSTGTTGTTEAPPNGHPIDCGTAGESGWPTIPPPDPSILRCLISAFEAGAPAVATHWTYDGPSPEDQLEPPPGRITRRYEVIGVRLVRVTTDRTQAWDEPKGITVEDCRSLEGEVFMPHIVGDCTPA
jgi:hypothetical protein